MLEARDITIKFGPCEVLSGVTLAVRPGEVTALLGPNGAGKTTLVKALNGTLTPAAGSVMLEGREIHKFTRAEIARLVAVVAQENETKFPVTVRDFILAGRFARGSAFGWETPADIAAAERAMDECDLTSHAGRTMNELSGGERQRVVLARAIATEASILLLDEPTANLDLSHQAMMFRLVRERCNANGHAALAITHDLNLAAEFADTVVMLARGRVFADGTPDKVLTESNIAEVFGVRALTDMNPVSGNVRVTTIF